MKRLIILLASFNIFGYIYADNPDLKESYLFVIKYGSVIDTVWDNVRVSTEVIKANTVINYKGGTITSPEFDSWLFLIDKMPDKYGNHPCKYIFAGNSVRQIRHYTYNAAPDIEQKNFLYKKQNEIPPIKVYDPKYLSQDNAFKLLQRKKLVDLQKNNVLVSQLIIPANTVVKVDLNYSMLSPNFDSWLFVIDLVPDAKWDHPCKYIFVDIVSKKVKIFDMNCPPLIPLDYLKYANNY